MDLFIHKFVTISPRKVLGKNCSEIHFAGTTFSLGFLPEEENISMDSKYAINIKEIKTEIDAVKKTSKTIIIKNGEPCIQQLGLKSLAEHIKKEGFYLMLETYGTKPGVLRDMINNKLVDSVILKLYFPLQSPWLEKMSKESLLNREELIENIKKTIELLRKSKVNVHIKTIVVPSLIYKKSDICKIARAVKDIPNCMFELMPFNPEGCNKYFMHIKTPSEEFMEETKQGIREMYPALQVR